MISPPSRRAILSVPWGPLASRKAILAPGQTIRVGRSNLADLALPHDGQMSAEHFALAWDGERCFLRDLQSAKGTWLQGDRVQESVQFPWVRVSRHRERTKRGIVSVQNAAS